MKHEERIAVASLAVAVAALSPVMGAPPPEFVNAVLPAYGARVTIETMPGVVKDRQTGPQALLDGNPHTRAVVTGTPYVVQITLPFRAPVERLSFAQSDLNNEAAPKELEIVLDDGQVLRHTLALTRPEKRRAVWQDVPLGRDAQRLKITVRSVYDGVVKWGGLGDIAVWTPAALDQKFRVPDYDAAAPTFVNTPPLPPSEKTAAVRLPPVARPGEHPRLLFTPKELADLRAALPQSEKGKKALATLLQIADAAARDVPNFPDPKGPGAQLKDRGDELARRHSSLSKNAGTLGIAYAFTGEKKYALAAAAILKGYGRLYPEYPEHKGANNNDTSKVMAQRLSEAMWLIPQLEAYDYIYDSGVLSDADKQQIETQLFRGAIAMIRRKDPAKEVAERDARNKEWRTAMPGPGTGAVGNWINFYNAATMLAGVLLDDRNLLDLAAADFRDALKKGIGEDGLWGEGAIGYQMFALGAIVPGFEAAARQGIDLWSFDNNRLKQLFDSPLRYAYPDGTMPGINDSSRARLGNWSTMVYDYGLLRYGDAQYAFLVNESPRQLFPSEGVYAPTHVYESLPEPPSAQAGSTLFGNLGYAILRDARAYALLDYGPHGGTHGHPDKLNLLLFARGETGPGDEMGGEPAFHRYEDPLHAEWTTQTVAHNTMTVDEKSQAPGAGKLLLFEDTPSVKLMRAESATSYAGALLDRTVLVTPDAVIDLFHGRSSWARTWDRTFRYAGKLALLPAVGAEVKPLGASEGYQHVRVVQQQAAPALWQGAWQGKAGTFEVALVGAPGQQLMLGVGPDKEEMALARQSGTRGDFAAVYGLEAWGNSVVSARWTTTGAPAERGASVFEMTQKDGTVSRVVVAHGAGAWRAGGWHSDARVLYVRQKGEAREVLIGGGTFAQNGALEFRQNTPGNYLARGSGAKLDMVSSK